MTTYDLRIKTDASSGQRIISLGNNNDARIVVHSGNWDCGAFGGNIEMHTILQIIACIMGNIDCLWTK